MFRLCFFVICLPGEFFLMLKIFPLQIKLDSVNHLFSLFICDNSLVLSENEELKLIIGKTVLFFV